MKELTVTRKLTISALVVALYVVVMTTTRSFAFGQYQVRVATSLYALSGISRFWYCRWASPIFSATR